MDVLRTPDHRFSGLPDWPYEPHYTEVPDGDGGTLMARPSCCYMVNQPGVTCTGR